MQRARLLGALGLSLFGHGRTWPSKGLVATAALTSTVAADLLLHAGWRIPAPFLQRLLANLFPIEFEGAWRPPRIRP